MARRRPGKGGLGQSAELKARVSGAGLAKSRVTVHLPSLLAGAVEGRREVEVEGATVAECVDELLRLHPRLAVHLFDEERRLRAHVNLFHNETNLKWLDDWGVEVGAGDTLTVLQAVSGGRPGES